jgi:hypothetical protein
MLRLSSRINILGISGAPKRVFRGAHNSAFQIMKKFVSIFSA